MKIAIIQPGHDDFGLGAFYQRAFAALGHDVLSLAPLPPHDPAPATRLLRRAQAAWPGYLESRWSQILDQLIAARPQIVIFTRCETAPAGMIERVDELTGGACWNFYSDPPLMYPGPAALRMPEFFGSFSTIFSFARALVPGFYQLGGRDVRWLPFAHDPDVHRPVPPDAGRQSGFGYLGVWGPVQQRWVTPLLTHGLAIYGHGWEKAGRGNPLQAHWRPGRGYGYDFAQAVANHDAIFNLTRVEAGCAHSMKIFEILGSGGAQLLNWSEEAEFFFTGERDLLFFNSEEEFRTQARRLAENAGLRQLLHAAARKAVAPHTYRARAQRLLQWRDTGEYPADTDWLAA